MINFSQPTVIPSVRRIRELDRALKSPSEYILLSEVHIGNLQAFAAKCAAANKKVLVHADLIGGFKPDREGIKLLRNMYHVSGVLTQSSQVVMTAKRARLEAIQRVFIMDSRSLERGLAAIAESRPDGIEVLPGILASRYKSQFEPWGATSTLIAGGMVTTQAEAEQLFACGYRAITASSPELWEARF
ncbi:glycerol-3-phosphate responsive antiterminator [Actinomycetaceae bacterium L2_0104]